ncbi:MAG: hypothetical protein Q8877_03010, partial [Sweet potato little leaf phytoplasma]|nr:hypothetical protein [Sweet potato little leaf phytoplasma]
TAIMESKDMDTMELATLFGKLQEHEMELSRLGIHEESDNKKKSQKGQIIGMNRNTINNPTTTDKFSQAILIHGVPLGEYAYFLTLIHVLRSLELD